MSTTWSTSHQFSLPCSAFESSLDALKQPTIRVVAIVAEGVPERDTKEMIAYAKANSKIIIGPATVGGVQVCTKPLIYIIMGFSTIDWSVSQKKLVL